MLQKEVVLKAEFIWCLDVIQSKYSFRSSENKSKQLTSMFPDSKLVKEVLWLKKCACLVTHGLTPYFKQILVEDLKILKSF